jgi:RNA polymerase sigma-70 factor, ECF subfamily
MIDSANTLEGTAEGAYARLIERHRSELHAHCHRMLGSTHDAEDAVQEALLRAWKALPQFEGRSSLRSWLYTIATNASLDAMKRRPQRIVPIDQVHPADPHDGPAARYERRESLERALGAAGDLPRNQRTVLVMREMLGFSARETADALGTSVAAVNSALQRARGTIREQADEGQRASPADHPRSLGPSPASPGPDGRGGSPPARRLRAEPTDQP